MAKREANDGIDVASCKCCRSLRKGQLGAFSDEFLDHWETQWCDKNVRRFVLCVAADVRSQQRRKELRTEVERFKALGVEYDVWAPRQLQEKLRRHSGIVSQYLGEEWVPRLCGRDQPASAPQSSDQAILTNAVVAQLNALQTALSSEVEIRLGTARDQLRRGDRRAVEKEIVDIQHDEVIWRSLSPRVQARALRIKGLLCLNRGQIDEAEAIADEANGLHPAEESQLHSLIVFRREGPDAAIKVLGEPSTSDGQNLKVAFLLERGNAEAGRELLRTRDDAAEDPEAQRLLAIAHLMSGDRDGALAASHQAERLAPHWLAIRQAGGIVRYSLSLAPCVDFVPRAWPDPVPLEFVREDDEARRLLDQAETIFNGLLADDLEKDERGNLEIWRLACLANSKERAADAESYFNELIGQARTHVGAIIWGLSRGYPFNRARARKELETLLDSTDGAAEHVLALAALQLDEGRSRKALATLSRHESLFRHVAERPLLELWQAQAEIEAEGETMEWPAEDAPAWQALLIHVKKCRETGETGPLVAFAERHRGEPAIIYSVVRALGELGRWSEAARFTPVLLERVATAEAVRLAAIAKFTAGDAADALEILEHHVDAFPLRRLPVELRRLQVAAARNLGDLPKASRLALGIATETRTTKDLLSLVQTEIEAGDVAAALPHIGDLMEAPDLSVSEAVQLSMTVRHARPSLARELLQKALSAEIPNQLAGAALRLSLELGMEEQARPLYSALDAMAAAGDETAVKVASLEETVEIIRRQREHAEQLTQMYFRGRAPLHLIASAGNANLATIFWRCFVGPSAQDPTSKLPLLVHHGSRQVPQTFRVPFAKWSLHLDVTALLMAAHLGLLDTVERAGHPLTIPHCLPQVLLQLEQDARPIQPHRIDAIDEIVQRVDLGKIGVVTKDVLDPHASGEAARQSKDEPPLLLHAAAHDGGVMVDFDPPSALLPSEIAERVVNLRAIADALRTAGRLDEADFTGAITKLGTYGEPPAIGQLTPDQPLFFSGNTIEVLSKAGLLPATLSAFSVRVEESYLEIARGELANAEVGNEVAAWLGNLRERVAQGIERRTYRLLPFNPSVVERIADAGARVQPLEHCLFELLALEEAEDTVIWIDDRCCTGYSHSNGNPIVGIGDVLAAMRSNGVIDDARYFMALRDLRAARAAFLPISVDEVVYHLGRAPISKSQVTETPGLKALRQSFAQLLQLEEHLDLVGADLMETGKANELSSLHGAFRIADQVILAIWGRGDLDVAEKKTFSEWTWHALRAERFQRVPIRQATDEGRKHLFGLSLAGLFSGALQIRSKQDDESSTNRKDYLQWIYANIAAQYFEADPGLVELVAKLLTEVFVSLLQEDFKKERNELGDDAEQLAKALLKDLIDEFPEVIRGRLVKNPTIKSGLGIDTRTVVEFSGKAFPAEEFWNAIAKSLNEGKASVNVLGGTERLNLALQKDEEDIPILHITGAIDANFTDPIIGLVSSDVEQRETCLRTHEVWLDLPPEELGGRIHEIARIDSHTARVQALEDARSESAAHRYERLAQALASRSDIPFAYFNPPSAGAMARFIRIDVNAVAEFAGRLEAASNALIHQYGPVTAFRRLSGLPVRTPEAILSALFSLTEADIHAVRDELTSPSGSPLRKLHRLGVIWRLREHVDIGLTDVLRVADALIDGWGETARAFIVVLHWANRVFDSDADWRSMPVPVRLACVWTHAEWVTSILLDAGAPPGFVAEQFEQRDLRPVARWFQRDVPYETSMACPEELTPEILLFHGLNSVLGADVTDVLTPRQIEALKPLLTVAHDADDLPSPFLFQDRRNGENALGSFFVDRTTGIMAGLVDVSSAMQLGADGMDQFVKDAIAKVEHEPSEMEGWFRLAILGVRWLSPENLSRAAVAARGVDAVHVVRQDEESGLRLCRTVAEVAIFSADERATTLILERLVHVAELLATRYGRAIDLSTTDRNDPALVAVSNLAEAVFRLSACEDPKAAVAAFAKAAERLAARWPATVPFWRRLCDRFLRNLPFDWTDDLWSVYVKLRTGE